MTSKSMINPSKLFEIRMNHSSLGPDISNVNNTLNSVPFTKNITNKAENLCKSCISHKSLIGGSNICQESKKKDWFFWCRNWGKKEWMWFIGAILVIWFLISRYMNKKKINKQEQLNLIQQQGIFQNNNEIPNQNMWDNSTYTEEELLEETNNNNDYQPTNIPEPFIL